MPKCTIDGRETEVPQGATVIEAAQKMGIDIPHFCWHEDLPVDGNCRMCLVEIEKMPKLQIACNMQVTEGMAVHTTTPKAVEAHRTTLEFLLVNHPIDCPVCDQAGECYLQDQYMNHGLHDSRVNLDEKVHKRKVVDLGPIMLDAERCVLCTRCIRFEREVTKTNSFELVNRGDHTQIATFENRPILHNYAGNLADVCPVGALLSHDFRFKMRVWFLESTESVCPGCSTGCNISIDHRDGEIQRLVPRRNPDVNRSWMCDPGRAHYRDVGLKPRVSHARLKRGSSFEEASLSSALDEVARHLRAAGNQSALIASPQGTNEDLFAFDALGRALGSLIDFRVGHPEDKVQVREDDILMRADKNPNTQGCLELGLSRTVLPQILTACREGKVRALLLQGPELLLSAEAENELSHVPFIAVFASHEGKELERANVVLPMALWAELEGTFTNYARRVQRLKRAVSPPGDARAGWELSLGLLERVGKPLKATSAREVFTLLTGSVPSFRGLDYRALGGEGRVLEARS